MKEEIKSTILKKGITPVYSHLEIIRAVNVTEKRKQDIKKLLLSGVKVYLLTDRKITFSEVLTSEEEEGFKENYLLQIFLPDSEKFRIAEQANIIDGEIGDFNLAGTAKNYTAFNFEQFRIEHAPPDQHLSVAAGAGTGKTTVMIQRVMYLLQKVGASPKEIAMITFSKESASEMYRKLRAELFNRYSLTKQQRYLYYIEELKKMRISTIHSFAKMLLKELGSILGYGRNVQIRTFKMERERIIEYQLEVYFKRASGLQNIDSIIYPLRLYELIERIHQFWEEMEKKGMTKKEINDIKWGGAHRDSKFFNDLFDEIYPLLEESFQQFKVMNNAVSLNDLTRQVDLALRKNSNNNDENPFMKLSSPFKYIFIDEFQDSDDVQIRLISQMQKALQANIFVVGDIKQSIYRFRGADHTAFERLEKELNNNSEQVQTIKLRKNYRTAKKVLDNMHPFFEKWGDKKWLQYISSNDQRTDRLIGIRSLPDGIMPSNIIQSVVDKPKEEVEEDVVSIILQAKATVAADKETKKGKRKIALLVRTNREAEMLDQWCKKQKDIQTYLSLGGTFFTSDAVQHFSILIEAILFPKKIASIVNLLNTPYSSKGIHWTALASFNGNETEIYKFLEKHFLIKDTEGFPLIKFCRELRIRPVFSVLRKMIKKSQVDSRYYLQEVQKVKDEAFKEGITLPDSEAKKKALIRWKQYNKNINHLMDMLQNQYDSDFATLNSIYDWLKRNQATNREEDEPMIEEISEDVIQIMTVHKSKGLEFHTVILPFTERQFRYNFSEILLDKDKKCAGWMVKKENIIKQNNFYTDLNRKEDEAVLQEETRLLYVAMTRCQNQLWIIKNNYAPFFDINNWTKLLSVKSMGDHNGS
jgi:ATP-dependent exoDNAse (exonuclease V) beta subunit